MANRTGTFEVDPISRIEGHLGVKVTTDASGITEADVHGNMWRGFENFLIGRDANDAITFTQRICGVCPVPHGMTSTYAIDTVFGYSKGHITFADDGTYGVPAKAVLIRNLVLMSEFLMSSITHFYHLAAPSYVQGPKIPPWTPYFDDSYYDAALRNTGSWAYPQKGTDGQYSSNVWSTVIRSYVKALRVRRLTFEAGALFAGRMPMTSCYVAGGVTNKGTEDLAAKCTKYKNIMKEVGKFIIQEYVPIVLALGALTANKPFDNQRNGGNDYGAGLGNFLAWGAFPAADATGTLVLPGGVYTGATKDGAGGALVFSAANKAQVEAEFLAGGAHSVPNNLKECIAKSRYGVSSFDTGVIDASGYAYPGDVSRTKPNRANGYSYMKAPRWNGQAMEVGPLARLVVAGYYPVKTSGGTSYLRDYVNPAGIAGYTAYVKTVDNSGVPRTGLDPKMVNPDIAVALVRAGLAQLDVADGAGNWTEITSTAGLTATQITTNYASEDAVIMGTIRTWIYNLQGGLSTLDRVRARALESLVLVQVMIGAYSKTGSWPTSGSGDDIVSDGFDGTWTGGWIETLAGLADVADSTWKTKAVPTGVKQGWGGTEAPRGALMHQVTINNGKITKYQCIVPTTWNGSPKDYSNNRGAIEAAMIGVPFDDAGASFTQDKKTSPGSVSSAGGVEVLRVAQSFDPCIACAVH